MADINKRPPPDRAIGGGLGEHQCGEQLTPRTKTHLQPAGKYLGWSRRHRPIRFELLEYQLKRWKQTVWTDSYQVQLPYGEWTCVDGRRVLFNRHYEPLAEKLICGSIRAADASEWVDYIPSATRWIYGGKIAEPPHRDPKTLRRCKQELSRFGVTPEVREDLQDGFIVTWVPTGGFEPDSTDRRRGVETMKRPTMQKERSRPRTRQNEPNQSSFNGHPALSPIPTDKSDQVKEEEDMKTAAEQLDSYIRFRASCEGVDYSLDSKFFHQILAMGAVKVFGVTINQGRLVKDDQQPALFAEWKRGH